MRAGSVIVDLASEQGGNCELTEPGQVVVRHGVTIIGYTDLPSRLSKQSSTLYATNLLRLTEELCKAKDGRIDVNMEDEVIRGTTVIKEGAITWPPPPPKLSAAPPAKPAAARPVVPASERARQRRRAGFRQIDRHRIPRWRGALLVHRRQRAGGIPRPLHGVRARVLRRLHGDLERDTGAAHAAHERHQRDQQHHRHRRARAGGAADRRRRPTGP